MNPKLIKEITVRVQQLKQEQTDESVLAANLDAIAEVYETDRATVESIAKDVISSDGVSKRAIDLAKIRNIVWISALLLIMVSVIWLLYSNTQAFKRGAPSDISKENKRTVEYVNQALQSLNVVKISLAENFQTTGSMPSSFTEIGVQESELVATKYIDRLQIAGDGSGTVTISLSRLIGDHRYIKLKPMVRIASHEIEWDCRSNLKPEILDALEGCTPDI